MVQQVESSAAARKSEEQVLISSDAVQAMVRAANAFVPYVAVCAHEEALSQGQGQGQRGQGVVVRRSHVQRAATVMQIGL